MNAIPTHQCPFCNHSLTHNQDLGIRLHCDNCLQYYVYMNKERKITKCTFIIKEGQDPEIMIHLDISNGSSEIVIFGRSSVTTKIVPLIDCSDFSKIKNRIQKLLAFL